MKIVIDTDKWINSLKRKIENFCYTFGFKVYFEHPPVKFLENTLNTQDQFNNLLEYYKALKERHDYYQRPEWNGKHSDKKFKAPTIELVPVNDSGQHHYAMIWQNETRIVKVMYRVDGELFWVSSAHKDKKSQPFAAGGSFMDVDMIWELY